jgi:hypothetical protein
MVGDGAVAHGAGWYRDEHGRHPWRWWDGQRWTAHVSDGDDVVTVDPAGAGPFASAAPGAPDTAAPPDPTPSGRFRAMTANLGDRAAAARERVAPDGAGAGIRQAIAATGQFLAQQATPERAAFILERTAPVAAAAADGAGLRNKRGKVKVWRVLRVATRPRKYVSRAVESGGRAAHGAALDGARAAVETRRTAPQVRPTDRDILAEWADVDPSTAVDALDEGLALFGVTDPDDRSGLRTCAALIGCGLSQCLVGPPLVPDDDVIVRAAGTVLTASLLGSGRETWTDADERHVRLALAIARRFGVQADELGGTDELGELFEDPHDRMIMAMAVAPDGWSCDLRTWFAAGGAD